MVYELAAMKLVGVRANDKVDKLHQKVAVVAQRLLLELEPNIIDARTMEETLVASNMRTVYSIPQHREYMRTGSPSEPLLVELAARYMRGVVNPIDVLTEMFSRGLTTKDERGELVGRLLDILAIDKAVSTSLSRDPYFPYSTPVTVEAYLACLISKTHLQDVLNSKPVNTHEIDPTLSQVTLREMFSDCWIHTTHYVRAEDSTVLQTKSIWAYWIRGSALQLKPGQELSDRMMPIHWASFPEVLDAARNAWLERHLNGNGSSTGENATVAHERDQG